VTSADGTDVVQYTLTFSVPEPAVTFTAKAEVRHFGQRAFLAVDVVNGEDVPVDILIQTAYGERTLDDVPLGKELTQLFPARATTAPAGDITVTATAEIDGEVVTATKRVAYDAR
jgi:hypothetical protein